MVDLESTGPRSRPGLTADATTVAPAVPSHRCVHPSTQTDALGPGYLAPPPGKPAFHRPPRSPVRFPRQPLLPPPPPSHVPAAAVRLTLAYVPHERPFGMPMSTPTSPGGRRFLAIRGRRVRLLRTIPFAAALLLVTACRAEAPAGSGVTLLDGKGIAVSGPTVISALPIDDQGNVEAAVARSQIPSLKSVALQYPDVRVLITDSDGRTTDAALRNFAANWSIPSPLVVAAAAASRPASSPRPASQPPQFATHASTCSGSTRDAPSGSVEKITVKWLVVGTCSRANGRL